MSKGLISTTGALEESARIWGIVGHRVHGWRGAGRVKGMRAARLVARFRLEAECLVVFEFELAWAGLVVRTASIVI